MKTKKSLLRIGSNIVAAALMCWTSQTAQATQSPIGCSANNLNVNIGVLANNITNGTTVTWNVTVQNPANATSCDVTLGSEGLYFICPGPDGSPTGTRTTLIPGGTTISPGYGPQQFTIQCLVNVNAGVRTAEGKVSAPGSVVHKNPLQDDPASVEKTISVNLFQPCINLRTVCTSAVNSSGSQVTVTYSGFLTNCGNVLLNDVTVYNGQTAVFGPIGLPANGSTNFTTSYTTTDLCGPFVTSLNALGTAPLDTPAVVTSASSSTCTIAYNPAISVTKVCQSGPVRPGDVLSISGVVSNAGNIALSNVKVVNSQPAAGTVLLSQVTLAVGQTMAYSGSYVVPLDSCGPYTDTVIATGTPVCGTQTVQATATASCPGTNSPSIKVTRDCPANPVAPGATLTYTGSVTNAGDITLNGVTVVSDKPTAGTRVFGPVSLAPGAGATFTASYTVPANSCGPYQGTVTATGQDKCFGVTVTHSATSACAGITAPAIKVTKTCPTTPVAPGSTLTYSATVQNMGNIELRDVSVAISGAASGIVFTTNSLLPGVTARFTGSYQAPADTCDVTDTLTANAADLCGNQINNSTTTTCPLTTTAGLAITRTCPDAATLPGQPLVFTGWLTNTGNITLTNVTIAVDRPQAGTIFFTTGTLSPGQAAGFNGSFVVPTNLGACTVSYNLSAQANNKCTGAAVTANTSGTCPVVTTPRIVVIKACPPTPVAQGSTLTYSGTVSNAGNVSLKDIVVVNNMPTSNTVVFRANSLLPGQTTNFTGSYTVPGDCCTVIDTLQAQGTDVCSGASVTNTSSALCPVQFTPRLKITKICPTTSVAIGDQLTYSGTISNAGNITITEVVVFNRIIGIDHPLLEVAALAPGESMAYTSEYTVPADFCGSDTVTVQGFSICANAYVSDNVTSTCPITTAPALAVTRTCPAAPIRYGEAVTFTAMVMNTGNVTLTNVTVINSMPAANTPVFGPVSLNPGQATNFTFTYTAPLNCNCCELVDTLTARGQDRCSGRSVAVTSTTACKFETHPRVLVSLDCPTGSAALGGLVSYGGTVMNLGDCSLTNVVVTSSLPSGQTQVFGPVTLARGEARSFFANYTMAANTPPAASMLITASGTAPCSGLFVTSQDNCAGNVVVTPPELMEPAIHNGVVSLAWTATSGVTYRVQSSSNLQAWQNEAGDVVAQGSSASKDITGGSEQQRFFRVMIVP